MLFTIGVHSAAEPHNLQAAHWYLSQIISD